MLEITLLRDKNNPTYQKYLAIMKPCKEANIDPPAEVDEYFGGDGMDNELEYPLQISFQPREWFGNDGLYMGYEIDLADLPVGVKTIRFYE